MGGIIKLLVQALFGGLVISLPTIIKRLMIAFGVGIVAYTGFSQVMSFATSEIMSAFNGLPSVAAQIAGILNIDRAISVVLSAYSIKMTFQFLGGATGMTGGLGKKKLELF